MKLYRLFFSAPDAILAIVKGVDCNGVITRVRSCAIRHLDFGMLKVGCEVSTRIGIIPI